MFNSETPAAVILKDKLEKGLISRGDYKKHMETLNKLGEVKEHLEKGGKGEGSRGGKIIGHTKSGKPIYDQKIASHADYSNYSDEDHIDARKKHLEEWDKRAAEMKENYVKHGKQSSEKDYKKLHFRGEIQHSHLVAAYEKNPKNKYFVSGESDKEHLDKKSDKLQKASIQDTLEKALSDDLRYGSDIKFKKTGKEVVEALDKASKICDANKTESAAAMAALAALLPNPPFVPCNSYRYNGFQNEIGEQLCFPYDMCYMKSGSNGYGGNTNSTFISEYSDSATTTKKVDFSAMLPTTQAEADQYRQYNSAVDNYISCCAECCMVDMYRRNIDQKKSYEISPSIAAGLGF